MNQHRNILIIGSSIAGITAAEAARKQDPEAQITVVSRDTHPPYYRLRICEVLDDRSIADQLDLHPPVWYRERRITLMLHTEVLKINPERHVVELSDGRSMPYTVLIIATGSQSFVPLIPGISRPGIHTLWTLEDALQIENILHNTKSALVVGGGLLGLEAAYHIRKKGIPTTIVEKMPCLLANQLDEKGSQIFRLRVKNLDVNVLTSAEIVVFEGDLSDSASPVTRATLADGTVVEADFVLVSIGVHALADLAHEAGIKTSRRIVTDEAMRTSNADIYAAGDVAEPLDYWFGLWSVSKAQGQVAGVNAAGGDARFDRTVPPYLINTMETKVAVQGDKGLVAEPHYELDVLLDEKSGNYHKLIYRDGIFSGFILVGDTREFVKLQKAIGDPRLSAD